MSCMESLLKPYNKTPKPQHETPWTQIASPYFQWKSRLLFIIDWLPPTRVCVLNMLDLALMEFESEVLRTRDKAPNKELGRYAMPMVMYQ